jgi:putative transposase
MHKVGTSFTNFINKKYNRSGSLFQGPYKAIHIDTNDYLLWLSGYVNGNAEIHGIADAEKYQWSSYGHFLGVKKDELITDEKIVLGQFQELKLKELSSLMEGRREYKKFVKVVIKESRKRKDIEKYLIEKI